MIRRRRSAKRGACLRGGGRILIADFAPHQLEFLRNEHAHRRLGFSDAEVEGWFRTAGLKPSDHGIIRCAHRQCGDFDASWSGSRETLAVAPGKRKRSRGMNLQSLGGTESGTSAVSFEFFPPRTRGDGNAAVERDPAACAIAAAICLGDLWRGRLNARPHTCDREAHRR